MKKLIAILLSLLIGLLFILSAYSKLFPIEPFEYNIVGTTFIGWKLSVLVARIIIGFEFYLGALFLFSYNHKRNVPIAIGLISIFSIHLIYQLLAKGNASDCGCFGNMFSMTPLQGLLKNIAILIVLIVLYKLQFNFKLRFKNLEFYLFLIAISAIFIINPVDYNYAKNYLNKPFDNFSLKLDTIYNSPNRQKIGLPQLDIRKGKYIVAFLSSTCGHCRIAAQKFSVIHAENPDIPIYLFINGEDDKILKFRTKNNIESIPYSKLNSDVFVQLAGLQLPVIYYLNNSIVEKQVDYFTLEQSYIEDWLKK